jgi:proteasome assembly chaperone (PAC2) family protein
LAVFGCHAGSRGRQGEFVDAKEQIEVKPHWLVAGWPGMSNVASIACGYLIQKLGLKPVTEIAADTGPDRFEIDGIHVREGRVIVPRPPRTVFYTGTTEGQAGVQITVLLAEAQPDHSAMAYARQVLERARALGVNQVATFASVATQLEPSEEPMVYACATSEELVHRLADLDIAPLDEGEIGGLNGLLVGAAALASMPGVCLMGEIPYYAAQIANPKASKAVLNALDRLTGVRVDLDELDKHARRVDRVLEQLKARLETEHAESDGDERGTYEPGREAEVSEAEEAPARSEPSLDLAARRRIEELFENARKDKSKGIALKQELDKLGVFPQFEDRFLDLFRRAE